MDMNIHVMYQFTYKENKGYRHYKYHLPPLLSPPTPPTPPPPKINLYQERYNVDVTSFKVVLFLYDL